MSLPATDSQGRKWTWIYGVGQQIPLAFVFDGTIESLYDAGLAKPYLIKEKKERK